LIASREVARAINYHRENALVVSTSAALREWHQVSDRRDLDVDLTDCMDRAPAVGLGLSLAQPNRRILVLDCDATLRTDLAGLATIGEVGPENLVHFVFEDVDHSSTEGLPILGLDRIDFEGMARSAGYTHACRFENLEELLIGMEEIMRRPGPVLVAVKVIPEGDASPFPERTMLDGWAEVRSSLAVDSERTA
jgi:phosphonopyruvate decarboxylase